MARDSGPFLFADRARAARAVLRMF